MSRAFELTGQRFGRLVVIKRAGRSASGNLQWLCQCDCGNQVVVDSYRLRHRAVRSCGCLRKEQSHINILANPKTVARMHAGKQPRRNPAQPVRLSLRNTSGVTGVSWDAKAQKWAARLMVDGRLVLNQLFQNFGDAVSARQRAETIYHVPPRVPRPHAKRCGPESLGDSTRDPTESE